MSDENYRLRVRALHDPRVLCNLLRFHGGWKNFSKTIHNELIAHLARPQLVDPSESSLYRKRVNLLPRGHLKSTVSVLIILWRLYRNPNLRILIGCDDKELAKSFLREVKFYLESTELQEKVWHNRPHIPGVLVPVIDAAGKRERIGNRDLYVEQLAEKVVWSSEMIYLVRQHWMKEPSIGTISVDQSGTGDHFDLLVLDDIVNFYNSDTPKKAEKIFTWAADMTSVLDPAKWMDIGSYKDPETGENVKFGEYVGGEQILNGTLYYKWDYWHHVMKTQATRKFVILKKNIYINGVDSSNGYIYPEKFNPDYESEVREDCITFRRFSCQYLLKVIDSSTQVLVQDDIQIYNPETIEVTSHTGVFVTLYRDIKKQIRPILTIDIAISQLEKADSSAITVGGVDDEDNLVVLDAFKGKVLPDTFLQEVFKRIEEFNITKLIVEGGVGYQDSLIYAIRAEATRQQKLILIDRYVPRGDKKTNIELVLQPVMVHKKLWMPQKLLSKYESEFEFFPQEGGEDDLLDTLKLLRMYSKKLVVNKSANSQGTRHLTVNTRYGGCR